VISDAARTLELAHMSSSMLLDPFSTRPATPGIWHPDSSCALYLLISQEPRTGTHGVSWCGALNSSWQSKPVTLLPVLCKTGLRARVRALRFEKCVHIALPQPPPAFLGYERLHKTGMFPWLLRYSLVRGLLSASARTRTRANRARLRPIRPSPITSPRVSCRKAARELGHTHAGPDGWRLRSCS